MALDVKDHGLVRFQCVERRSQVVEPRDKRAVQAEDDVPGNEFVLPGIERAGDVRDNQHADPHAQPRQALDHVRVHVHAEHVQTRDEIAPRIDRPRRPRQRVVPFSQRNRHPPCGVYLTT